MTKFITTTKQKYELVNITDDVSKIVADSGVNQGLVLVFAPHSTCGIILTEDEPGLKKDWLKFLEKITAGFDFEHNKIDNNAQAHILTGLLAQGKILPVQDHRLVRGTWQDIFLVEFDGPRTREIFVEILGK